jgi:hypothetical protein
MKVLARLTILLIVITGLGACGGDKKSVVPKPEEKPNQSIKPKTELKGIPTSFQVKACIDEQADFICDTSFVSITDVYNDIDIDKLGKNARVLIELAPPETTGISSFVAYEGKRYMSFPVGEEEASPFNLLALGVVKYAQELGDDWCCGHAIPLNLKQAKTYLFDKFNLDGSGHQNKAILQAFNSNLELLGGNGLSLQQAYDADIKAMAESLINLTLSAQSICDRLPEYCEGNPDDPYPPIDLSNIVACNNSYDGGPCVSIEPNPKEESKLTDDILRLNNKEATNIAYDIRASRKEQLPHEIAFDQLVCKDDEAKEISMFGMGDNFSTSNIEATNPSSALATWLATVPSNIIHPYDFDASITPANPNVFADSLTNLPSDLSNGLLVLGLKERGFTLADTPSYFDTFIIGDATNLSSSSNVSGTVSGIRSNWQNISPNVYFENLQNLNDQSGSQSLFDKLQAGQTDLDFVILPTTNVDFVAVAACRIKKPQKPEGIPVKEVISVLKEKFTCDVDKGETYYEIAGGNADDFTPGSDQNTPSPTLLSQTGNLITYDQVGEKDSTFIDTLTLPSSSITKAQFMINARASSPGAMNDKVFLADSLVNNMVTGFTTITPGTLVTQWPNNTLNGGVAYIIDGAFHIPSIPSTPNLITILNSGSTSGNGLDILVSENTEVDTTLLQLCVIEGDQPCIDTDGDGYCDEEEKEVGSDPSNPNSTPLDLDGDGVLNDDDCDPNDPEVTDQCDDVIYTDVLPESCNENITVDLGIANSWLNNAGSNPVVNNVFDGTQYQGIVWDGALSWFDFGSASNITHKLTKDFCSCGGGKVIIDEFKSDNMGYIDINNMTNSTGNRIVSRTLYSQSTMANWGPNESGSNTFSGTGNGVDFNLELSVTNVSGPSGGAVKGRLEFIGHLGSCTAQDVIETPGGTGNVGGVVGPIINVGSIEATHDILSNIKEIKETTAPFIKLDDNGNPLAIQTLPWSDNGSEQENNQWSCVKDVKSNLIWEVKRNSNGIKKDSIHDADDVFHWYDSNPSTNGGLSGTNTSANFCYGYDGNDSSTFCNSERFQNTINSADFCGSASEWRLPTIDELEGLVDSSYGRPTINGAYFPNTPLHSVYWSSTSKPNEASKVGYVGFYTGGQSNAYKSNYAGIRLVRD